MAFYGFMTFRPGLGKYRGCRMSSVGCEGFGFVFGLKLGCVPIGSNVVFSLSHG